MTGEPQPGFARFMRERSVVAQAYVSGDPAPLIALSTDHEPATFFGPRGGVEVGAKHVIDTNVAGATQFRRGGESQLEIIQMTADGDLAFWTGLQHAKVRMQGRDHPVAMTLRVTEVFRQEESAWKLVHRHADSLADTASSAGKHPKTSELARRCLQAYVDKARDRAEALIAEDFRFTSPLDNGLDREAYFRRCWPNSSAMRAVHVVEAVDSGNRALVVYECQTDTKRFRNCEMHESRDGQLVSVEVYFGWDLPHPAAPGHFVTPQSDPATT